MQAAGLAQGDAVLLPMTQAHVADSLGLSVVHVNRMLQELRGDGLITWQSKALAVLDWDGLQRAGEFHPAYLHLAQEVA